MNLKHVLFYQMFKLLLVLWILLDSGIYIKNVIYLNGFKNAVGKLYA